MELVPTLSTWTAARSCVHDNGPCACDCCHGFHTSKSLLIESEISHCLMAGIPRRADYIMVANGVHSASCALGTHTGHPAGPCRASLNSQLLCSSCWGWAGRHVCEGQTSPEPNGGRTQPLVQPHHCMAIPVLWFHQLIQHSRDRSCHVVPSGCAV